MVQGCCNTSETLGASIQKPCQYISCLYICLHIWVCFSCRWGPMTHTWIGIVRNNNQSASSQKSPSIELFYKIRLLGYIRKIGQCHEVVNVTTAPCFQNEKAVVPRWKVSGIKKWSIRTCKPEADFSGSLILLWKFFDKFAKPLKGMIWYVCKKNGAFLLEVIHHNLNEWYWQWLYISPEHFDFNMASSRSFSTNYVIANHCCQE